MTFSAWLATASPTSPPRLVAHVEAVVRAHPVPPDTPVDAALVGAAERLLASVIGEGGGAARERAVDLLAADACVTWAFEASADDVGTLPRKAHAVIAQLAQAVR